MNASIEEASIVSWNRVHFKLAAVRDVEIRIETSFAAGEEESTMLVASRGFTLLPLAF